MRWAAALAAEADGHGRCVGVHGVGVHRVGIDGVRREAEAVGEEDVARLAPDARLVQDIIASTRSASGPARSRV